MSAIAHSSTKPDTQDSDKVIHERIAAARARALGAYGADYASDIDLLSGQTWGAIQAIAATTFADMAGNITGLVNATLPAGAIVYGRFTLIEVGTGKIIAYRAI